MKARIIAAVAAAVVCCGTAQAATTINNWSFVGQQHSGSGTLSYDDATDQLITFNGSYNGQALSLVSFTSDPNNLNAQISYNAQSGLGTYRAVPNTGGANYDFDNKAHQTPTTNNFLVSTGTGANEIVYSLGYDQPSNFFFFHIVTQPQYAYVQDNGTYTMSAVAATAPVPEPATWAMMTLGFGAMGFAMRRKNVSTRIRFA